jgi:Fe-S-cluster-containing dehydrogenase component
MTRYRLRIVDDACWGCRTCEVACKQENGAPTGVRLIEVKEEGPIRDGDGLRFRFRVARCRHCRRPRCVEACPSGAIHRREDGIVVLREEACDGCRACITACPHGAIGFDEQRRVAAKCNLCVHRIDQGLLPACADNVCLAHCIHLVGAETTG